MLSAARSPAIGVGPKLKWALTGAILGRMKTPAFIVHGPATPGQPPALDSAQSGVVMPADFASVRTAVEFNDGEDCFIDALYPGVTARGVPLLVAPAFRAPTSCAPTLLTRSAGFATLQAHLMQLIDARIHPNTDHPIPEAHHAHPTAD